MRRRPRPFMLSASTSDGAALVVIVGLLCLPFSAFVALPAMLLTARLVDSISITQDISAQAMEAVKNGELYVCAQADGTITIAADGTVPTCDIPTVIILLS